MEESKSRIPYRRAHFTLQIFLTIMFLGTWIGATWDRLYHASQPFEDFWSAPHLFVYGTASLAGLIVMGLVFNDNLRQAFGRGFSVIILPFDLPGPLFILSAGMVSLGFAGLVLDNFWHSNFGLDETSLSFPHALIGWSLLLIGLGYIAARLALRVYRPLRWYTVLLLGFISMSLSADTLTLSLMSQRTPETLQFVANLPALASQEAYQHSVRIIQTWGLFRSHALLLILAPLWLGAAISFIRQMDKRWWIVLLITLLVWAGDSQRDFAERIAPYLPSLLENPANWQAIPIFFPVLVMAIFGWFRWSEKLGWSLAALVLALSIYSIWGVRPEGLLLVPFAPLSLWFGRWLGIKAYSILDSPDNFTKIFPLLLVVLLVPFFTGIVDLLLRIFTP